MALLAQDEIDAFRRRNAYEFREHERIIRAMRRENIHMLYTERPKGAEDCRMRNLGRDTLDVVGSDTEEHVGSEPLNVGYHDRGTGAMPPPVLEEPAVDEYNDESGMASKEALPKGTGQKLGGETRIRSTSSGAENETDVDVNAIVNRIVKDECNKMKDQWAKDYKFARDMIVTNPVGPPSFANEPQQDKAYEAAPRPAAAGSAVDAATHRMIDRVVGEQVAHMINDVMWRHGLAFDQTTGRVNHRITQERRLAQDSRLRPRRFARSA